MDEKAQEKQPLLQHADEHLTYSGQQALSLSSRRSSKPTTQEHSQRLQHSLPRTEAASLPIPQSRDPHPELFFHSLRNSVGFSSPETVERAASCQAGANRERGSEDEESCEDLTCSSLASQDPLADDSSENDELLWPAAAVQSRLRARSSFCTEHFHSPSTSPTHPFAVPVTEDACGLERPSHDFLKAAAQTDPFPLFPDSKQSDWAPTTRRNIQICTGTEGSSEEPASFRPFSRRDSHARSPDQPAALRRDDNLKERFYSFDESCLVSDWSPRLQLRNPAARTTAGTARAKDVGTAAPNQAKEGFHHADTTPYGSFSATPYATPRSSPATDEAGSSDRDGLCPGDKAHLSPAGEEGSRQSGARDQDGKGPEDRVPERMKQQKRKMVVLSVVTFLYSCAGQFHNPVLNQYMYQIYTERVYGNASQDIHVRINPCPAINASLNASSAGEDPRETQVQDDSADLSMRLELVSGGIAVAANILLGSYADVVGRRFVLLLSLTGHFLRNATVPAIVHWKLGLSALYAGYVLDGLCGGFSGVLLGLHLYAADITRSNHQRTMGMTIVETVMGLTVAVTIFAAGWLIQKTGFVYASLLASFLVLLAMAVVFFFLPETVIRSGRGGCISPVEGAKRVVRLYLHKGHHPHQRVLLLLALLSFLLTFLPSVAESKLKTLYLMRAPLCWSAVQIGLLIAVRDVVCRLASLTLILLLKRRLATPFLTVLGAVSEAAGDVMVGLATDTLVMNLSTVPYLARGMTFPTIRSMLSRMAPPASQGAVFASLAVVESVSLCFGQLLFLSIYEDTLIFFPGFAFLVIAGFYLGVACISVFCALLMKKVDLRVVKSQTVQAD